MDHVVYVDAKAKELDLLLSGEKVMVARGAAGRKLPHGRVFSGDTLFFINNDGSGQVRAQGRVKSVINSEKLSPEEAAKLLEENGDKLRLAKAQYDRWAGKRYLVLLEVEGIAALEPFAIDRSAYGNMDDWLPVGDIGTVRI